MDIERLKRHSLIRELEDARAMLAVFQDLDQLLSDYEPKLVLVAYYMQCRNILHTAQDTGYAEATVRGYLNAEPFKSYLEALGYQRRKGRPLATHCKRGHDLSVTRKRTPAGAPYCEACKPIQAHTYYENNRDDIIRRTTESTRARRQREKKERDTDA